MPKHDFPKPEGSPFVIKDNRKTPFWHDRCGAPKMGQRQAKHARQLRVPGKGSGR